MTESLLLGAACKSFMTVTLQSLSETYEELSKINTLESCRIQPQQTYGLATNVGIGKLSFPDNTLKAQIRALTDQIHYVGLNVFKFRGTPMKRV